MKIIESVDELKNELAKVGWFPREKNPRVTSNYPRLNYECGCGDKHLLEYAIFDLVAPPAKFIFQCENDYLTAVSVKGIFKQKSIELWSCKLDLYSKAFK